MHQKTDDPQNTCDQRKKPDAYFKKREFSEAIKNKGIG